MRNGLVAAELSLATMLLVEAGLLMQSLSRLEKVHLGFRPEGILSFQLAPPAVKYPDSIKRWTFFREVLQALSTIPGVTGAAMSSGIPMGQGSYNRSPFMPTGSSILPAGTAVPIDWRIASSGYFRLMGIPPLDGRDFSEQDRPKATDVIILSRSAARKLWGDENPIGKMVHRPTIKSSYTVIGVVGEVRHTSLNQEFPCLYFSAATFTAPLMDMVIRTQGRPDSVLSAARKPLLIVFRRLESKRRRDYRWLGVARSRLNCTACSSFCSSRASS